MHYKRQDFKSQSVSVAVAPSWSKHFDLGARKRGQLHFTPETRGDPGWPPHSPAGWPRVRRPLVRFASTGLKASATQRCSKCCVPFLTQEGCDCGNCDAGLYDRRVTCVEEDC